ncbi:hypothetical protein PVAND_015429 [Polypedilum vanderplanki]|uniref:Fatty acyl-CoA reductase n=1 Tax=Polypedilum vanderplanki TaxID=319348 RepID=A0A9J6BC54_POLVA|nr:hypothetical protein PVAND_015429 [Polypedilum vanderplanki]
MARKTKKLDAYVHVSTCYANWFIYNMEEIFYEPKYDPNEVLEMCRTLNNEELRKKIPTLSPHLNTYTFTKSLSEYLISKEGLDLPIAIVRPSIAVTSSLKEPFPGWIDNWGGTTPHVYMAAKGLVRNLQMRKDVICDAIPADFVINMILATGWKIGTDKNSKNSLPIIYNCSTSSINPILFKDFYLGCTENGKKYPHSDVLWYPKLIMRNSVLSENLSVLIYQKIPSYIGDFVLRISGKKPRFVLNTQLVFQSKNPTKLANSMNHKDLKEFDFNVKKIDWKKYIDIYHLGMRKYLGKDNSENFDELRRKVERLKYARYLMTGSLLIGSFFFLHSNQNSIENAKYPNMIKKEIEQKHFL